MISITNASKEPHITPLQDSMWHRGMAGIDSCVFNFFENFAAEVSSNNSVKIRSGIGMIQGRYFCVEPSTYDEVTIANGTQGEKRKDLIVCRWTVDEEQKVQSGDWVVIQGTPTTGTPAAPSYTAGDLDAGDLIADMPFYEVTLDGINVTGVTQKFTSLSGIKKAMNIPSNALKFLTGNGNGDTPTNWGKAGPGMAYISTEGMLTNQPMKYGWLTNYTAGGSVVAQQFVGLDGNSPVYYRSGNASGWYPGSKSWVRSLDEKNGVQIKKVWTNTSPGSDFPEQTIELNVTDASFILVIFKITKNSNLWKVAILTCDGNSYIMDAPYNIDYTSSGTVIGTAFRGAVWKSNGIQFGKGYSKDHLDKNSVERPSFVIPIKIFAVKGAI